MLLFLCSYLAWFCYANVYRSFCKTPQLLAGSHADRFLEFWDVGGNPNAERARRMFFEDSEAAGVLLVYDLSNPRHDKHTQRAAFWLLAFRT